MAVLMEVAGLQRDGLRAVAPFSVMAGKNLYAPLASSVVLELLGDSEVAKKVADLASIATRSEFRQAAHDEHQEMRQREWKQG